mmetsp:Transcript_94754/g.272767  ORF Transcript_94754/g.272767 Transcript_94754/m.272767 type:complete len:310 (-) Transcript_94754:8-937(-)
MTLARPGFLERADCGEAGQCPASGVAGAHAMCRGGRGCKNSRPDAAPTPRRRRRRGRVGNRPAARRPSTTTSLAEHLRGADGGPLPDAEVAPRALGSEVAGVAFAHVRALRRVPHGADGDDELRRRAAPANCGGASLGLIGRGRRRRGRRRQDRRRAGGFLEWAGRGPECPTRWRRREERGCELAPSDRVVQLRGSDGERRAVITHLEFLQLAVQLLHGHVREVRGVPWGRDALRVPGDVAGVPARPGPRREEIGRASAGGLRIERRRGPGEGQARGHREGGMRHGLHRFNGDTAIGRTTLSGVCFHKA